MRRSVITMLIVGSVFANVATVYALVSVPQAPEAPVVANDPPPALVVIPVVTNPTKQPRVAVKASKPKRLANHSNRAEVRVVAEASPQPFISPVQVAQVADSPGRPQVRETFDDAERRYIEKQMALIRQIDESTARLTQGSR